MSLIEITHLRKEYPGATPLKDVNAVVEKGDVIAVIGPSGTGKSTLLRCINRLVEPTSGTVAIDGEAVTDPKCDIAKIRRRMGMVFQSFNLFDNLNVIGNVTAAPVKLLKMPKDEARREAMALLEKAGLADKAMSFPEELSGGQKQRVAIVRAIAMKPEIILLDEPTSALDPGMVGEVLSFIRELARSGMTMMIVTHEMRFARDVANRVFYMDEGGIYEEGTPEQIFDHPQRPKTRQFIRHLKILDLEVSSVNPDYYGLVQRIGRFGKEAGLSPSASHRAELVFEELVMQILLERARRAAGTLPVKAHFENADEDRTLTLSVTYGGPSFDPFAEGDGLSAMIIEKSVREKVYRFKDGNQVFLKLREE